MLKDLLPGTLACLLVLFLVLHRFWLLRKTREWRPVSAIVTDVRSQYIGEESAVLVDAEFLFDGRIIHARNVATDGIRITDHPKGSEIRVLVDPQSPDKCILENTVRALQR